MRIEGELTQWTVPDLLQQAGDYARADRLDLSGVTRADSVAIAFLLDLRRRRGAPLPVHDVPAQLDGLLDFYAVKSLLIGDAATTA